LWWYRAIKTAAQTKAYKDVVRDVSWVLDRMLDKGKKRAAEDDGVVKAKR
jgi:hypothetical protein